MNRIKIQPARLEGSIELPPSKSYSHRAIICAGLTDGKSEIINISYSEDVKTTINAMRLMGAEIKEHSDKLEISGVSVVDDKKRRIDCSESGSTLRFFIPIALLQNRETVFTGKNSLKTRPINTYLEIMDKQGIWYNRINRELPISIKGKLRAGKFVVDGNVSSQFITGLLFVLPLLNGNSKIVVKAGLESKKYVDMTIELLKRFEIIIVNNNYREFYVEGNQKYRACDYEIEGDFSQAAFWLAAGVLGGKVSIEGVNLDTLQGDKIIVDIIKKMGGNVIEKGSTLHIVESKLNGVTIDVSECPDLVPILAVLGALSGGTTKIINAKRLRFKESDRLKAISTELNKIGADIKENIDGLIIRGKEKLKGGEVNTWGDHRIAMALSIASIKCESAVIINNPNVVKKSYPNFFEDFKKLGGVINEFNMGK
ncbi:MAG: 3-phosphoshikimate 1-carboxyvinyltransferase [Alkaliphilus sp.]|nr:3-phosphoshikimate 1-carboxyvinyltransferase [bacterium AH-315-L21]PHS33396.1 MAG: 3-phosphoshikimate 1-carboxyvinyltransferase [Alkaliphilus sp.]